MRFEQHSGYTGGLFEDEVLGVVKTSWDGKTYFQFREAMNMVKQSQDGTPKTEFARKLCDEVAKQLHARPGEIKYYTSVRTPLDRFHGIDALLEFEGQFITIDASMNHQKEGSTKAHVIIGQEALDGDVDLGASDIVSCFKRVIKPRGVDVTKTEGKVK
ncbi:MAG: hypothetical protein WCW14_02825 [Candidatus Paceibacterota bacterium]|jgi:hypothetical protein